MSKGSRHGLDVWSSADLSTEKFTRCYLESNTPVIIKGCMDEWRSRREWVLTQTEQGGPPSELLHLKHLKDKFGTAEVPVVNSRYDCMVAYCIFRMHEHAREMVILA